MFFKFQILILLWYYKVATLFCELMCKFQSSPPTLIGSWRRSSQTSCLRMSIITLALWQWKPPYLLILKTKLVSRYLFLSSEKHLSSRLLEIKLCYIFWSMKLSSSLTVVILFLWSAQIYMATLASTDTQAAVNKIAEDTKGGFDIEFNGRTARMTQFSGDAGKSYFNFLSLNLRWTTGSRLFYIENKSHCLCTCVVI